MADNDMKQGKRFRLRAWHLVLTTILLLAGLLSLYVRSSRNDAEQRLKALRNAGYPTTVAELAEYTKLPEGTENAANAYMRAFAAFVPPADEANTPILGKARLPDRGASLSEPMAKAISDCLASNSECLALLHEAGGVEHCRYEWDYADELLLWKTQPHRDSVKHCGLLLYLSTVFHAHTGDANAVVTCIHDGFRLAESMRHEPGKIGHLVRIASRSSVLLGLERALSQVPFTQQQLEDLDRMLAASVVTLDLNDALITERCFAIEKFRDMERGGAPPLKLLIHTGELILWVPGIRERGLPDTLDYMADCIEAADLPVRERTVRFRQITDAVQARSIPHVKAKVWAPLFTERLFELDPRIRVHFVLARTALAIELYRLATGDVPGQLANLVPGYLEQVPLDPFDGASIRYRRTEPGYTLWSVMEDGRDNGRKEKDRVGQGEPHDLCFIITR
ncbi:MAG: hypothetical protein ABFD90_19080 [Phycisphaerales bacterium]